MLSGGKVMIKRLQDILFYGGKRMRRKRHRKNCLTLLLSAFLLVTCMPAGTFALENDSSEVISAETSVSDADFDVPEVSDAAGENGTYVESFSNSYRLTKTFTCKSKGYRLSLPSDANIGMDAGDFDARIETGGCILQITKEWSPYLNPVDDLAAGIRQVIPDFQWKDGKDQYFGYYQSRFILNKDWQQNNRVTVSAVQNISADSFSGMMYSAVISDLPADRCNGYTYLFLKMNSHFFLRIVAKYHSNGDDPSANAGQIQMLRSIASSLTTFTPSGSDDSYHPQYRPERTAAWSEETQALYDRIQRIGSSESGDSLMWGVYTDHVMEKGFEQDIPALEKKLNYNFSVVLAYIHFNGMFPTDFMNKAHENGKMVELTYQLTDNNNENLFADSVCMRLYRQDPAAIEKIRQFARDARALGHPFLFRLCNEMNSDWTSYGGVVNMADPDIFVENWRTIYRIFQEEGVDNCIWVYNPNNRNAPPDDWNGALNYYPGNEYVDLIGVTGYNTGTYYYSRWLEEWKDFTEIYDDIQAYYGKYFSAFPWMITEFSSSSVGGDKPAWIRSMFSNIGKYNNIKIAVWFSFADYDENGNVARPYWLDENPDTLMAFRHGLTGAPEFRDLGGTEWAVDAICEVTDAGYFTGTSDTTFEPSLDMSRAMIFTVIARMAGVDTNAGSEWYEAGMQWAMEQGITDGSSPFASISREQMVTMLYRYATGDSDLKETESVNSSEEKAGAESAGDETDSGPTDLSLLTGFPDVDSLSEWAQKAMVWAVANGIITGDDQGLLNPQGQATRAQVAVIISRFVKLF